MPKTATNLSLFAIFSIRASRAVLLFTHTAHPTRRPGVEYAYQHDKISCPPVAPVFLTPLIWASKSSQNPGCRSTTQKSTPHPHKPGPIIMGIQIQPKSRVPEYDPKKHPSPAQTWPHMRGVKNTGARKVFLRTADYFVLENWGGAGVAARE